MQSHERLLPLVAVFHLPSSAPPRIRPWKGLWTRSSSPSARHDGGGAPTNPPTVTAWPSTHEQTNGRWHERCLCFELDLNSSFLIRRRRSNMRHPSAGATRGLNKAAALGTVMYGMVGAWPLSTSNGRSSSYYLDPFGQCKKPTLPLISSMHPTIVELEQGGMLIPLKRKTKEDPGVPRLPTSSTAKI